MSTGLALIVGVVVSLAAPMASSAVASPSAAELVQGYPLHPGARDAVPGVTAEGRSPRSAGTDGAAVARYDANGADTAADSRLLLQLGMLIGALYVVFLCVWFSSTRGVSVPGAAQVRHARRRVRVSQAGTVAIAGLMGRVRSDVQRIRSLPATGLFALLQAPSRSGEPLQRSVPAGQTRHLPAERAATVRPETPVAPPDPAAAWRGEIDWREEDGAARFLLVARRLDDSEETIVMSPAFAWPPAGANAVEALTAAADQLEAALLEAGWSALGRGSAWYARRFGWEPAAVLSPAGCEPALRVGPWQRSSRALALLPARRQAQTGSPRSPGIRPTDRRGG